VFIRIDYLKLNTNTFLVHMVFFIAIEVMTVV
jgi:hypothetical protein